MQNTTKISIITVTYNASETIRDCIDSILSQSYDNVEIVIVDGKSSDNTMDIVKSYGEKIYNVVSEEDKGIFYAMNKGIQRATGDVIGILNSDDFYKDSSVLERVVKAFSSVDVDVVYGDIMYIDKDNKEKVTRKWRSGAIRKYKIFLGWMMPHPAVFVRKEVYKKVGLFNTAYPISADYDFILRIIKDKQLKFFHLSSFLTIMRTGGNSGKSFKRRIEGMLEVCRVFKGNFKVFPLWFFFTRPLIKIHQFFV